MWRVKNWNDHYESAESRRVQNARWVPVPNKQDGDGYLTLLEHRNGPALYGAWVAIMLLASKCSPRGTLIKSNGVPHTAETIAQKTHLPPSLIDECLRKCADPSVDWVEYVEDGCEAQDLFADAAKPVGTGAGASVGVSIGRGASVVGYGSETGSAQYASSSGNGIGNGITSSSSSAADAAVGGASGGVASGGAESEKGDPGVLAMLCVDGERWILRRSLLVQLETEFGAEVRVADCLRAMHDRLEADETLRKQAGRMTSAVRSWLRNDRDRFRDFAVGRTAKAQAKRPASGPVARSDLEKRAADLLGTTGKRGAA